MQLLHKGDCEHCHEHFNYSLWNAELGECSYAYCDACGSVATIEYHDPRMALLPPSNLMHQKIDASWEPYLAPCNCGGSFRRAALPRCPLCHLELSAEHAGTYLEAMHAHITKNWRWQGNWNDEYFIAMEDPKTGTETMLMANPFKSGETKKSKSRWTSLFSSD
ncbi:MAG: hypothetical protein KGN79_08745 [Acidobacteriota bacterium]|nr:hypothetical protein [Acidobacteriota bacterium]